MLLRTFHKVNAKEFNVEIVYGDVETTTNMKLRSLRILDCLWNDGMNKDFQYLATSEASGANDLIHIKYNMINKVVMKYFLT